MIADDIMPTRRAFLTASGLVIGFAIVPKALAATRSEQGAAASQAMNAYVKVGFDDSVTIMSKHLEWGQGVFSGLAALVAEELDADWSQMRAVHAPADEKLYANLVNVGGAPIQGTFGSTSIPNSYEQYRRAGATARAMFVAAAAAKWTVPAEEVMISKGVISHKASRRTSRFGALVELAAAQTPPETPALKKPADFVLIGKELPRLDVPDKTNGKAMFTMDAAVDGMLVAVVRHSDNLGAKLKSFDDGEARKVPGVVDVKPLPAGVAVYATDSYSALKGREQLKVEWDLSEAETRSTPELEAAYAKRIGGPGLEALKSGDVDKALAGENLHHLSSRFLFPYLAHAPMEVMDAIIVPAQDGSVDIIAGSQTQSFDKDAVSRTLKLERNQVRIDTQLAGGGFGRRGIFGNPFMAETALLLTGAGGKRPIKYFHSREDDIRGGFYRPMYLHDLGAAMDRNGKLVAWDHAIVGQPVIPRDAPDPFMIEWTHHLPYDMPNIRVQTYNEKSPVPPMPWRGVSFNPACFAIETVMDELLEMAGQDPVAGRLANMTDEHARAVIERVAAMSGWGSALPEGRQRGVAFTHAFGSYIAQVAEVSRTEDGTPRVHKVWCAIDCGIVINPNMVRAQIEGGIGFGLGAALFSEITLGEGGGVVQSNFHDYRTLRINEMPDVEVAILKSDRNPSGVGEAGVPPIGPAVANAWRKLTGEKVRRQPMVRA